MYLKEEMMEGSLHQRPCNEASFDQASKIYAENNHFINSPKSTKAENFMSRCLKDYGVNEPEVGYGDLLERKGMS